MSSYVAWYLFLAGAGSGAFLIGGIVDLLLRVRKGTWLLKISPITDAGLVVGPILVVLGSVFLLFDLGAPERAINVFLSPAMSVLGFGAWSIALFCFCAFISLIFSNLFEALFFRVVELVCSILATILSACVMVYSGVFLSLFVTVPFLHTPWIPILFVASAVTTGMAVLIVIGFCRQAKEEVAAGLNGLLGIDILFIVIEIAVIVAFFVQAFLTGGASNQSIAELITGQLSGAFWLGVVAIGLIMPFVVDIICCHTPNATALAVGACCTLVGGLCLRYVWLLAAIRFNLTDMSILSFWF